MQGRLGAFQERGATSAESQLHSASNTSEHNQLSPGCSRKEHGCLHSSVLVQRGPNWTADLQNRDAINLCCLQPRNLGPFVMAAIENSYDRMQQLWPPGEAKYDRRPWK